MHFLRSFGTFRKLSNFAKKNLNMEDFWILPMRHVCKAYVHHAPECKTVPF